GICLDWTKVRSFPWVQVAFEHWWSDDESPIAEASNRILQLCEQWKAQNGFGCSCEMVRQGGTISMHVPEKVVTERANLRRDQSIYNKAKKTVLIDSPSEPDPLQNPEAGLAVGSPLRIGYPYSDVDYSQVCHGTRSYVLAPVPESKQSEVMDRLSRRV